MIDEYHNNCTITHKFKHFDLQQIEDSMEYSNDFMQVEKSSPVD